MKTARELVSRMLVGLIDSWKIQAAKCVHSIMKITNYIPSVLESTFMKLVTCTHIDAHGMFSVYLPVRKTTVFTGPIILYAVYDAFLPWVRHALVLCRLRNL